MTVAVTGATGYLGAHTVAALRREGHALRLLLQPQEAQQPLSSYGVTGDADVVVGDVCDAEAVDRLLDGAASVVHLAGIVGVDDRRAELMQRVNVDATTQLLSLAAERGVGPVVHVSSYVALFPSPTGVIDADTPTAAGRSAYGRTKAAADRHARTLQERGQPVVIVYPPGIVGPALGDRPGIAAEGWQPLLRHRTTIAVRGVMPMVDVRDVADLIAAAIVRKPGPIRLPIGGQVLTMDEVLDTLERVTGTPFRRVRVGPRTFRAMGRLFDAAAAVLPLPASFSYEAAWLLTCGQEVDDGAARELLGRPWRDVRTALVEAVSARKGRGAAP